MNSLLVVSADPRSVEQIQHIAEPLGIRMRSVSSVDTAKEWLSMQIFDVVLIDSRYGDEAPIELVNLVWKYAPNALGGLFNLYGAVSDEWTAKWLGARVYSGSKALKTIQQTLESLPDKIALGDNLYVLLVEDLHSPRDIIAAYIQALGYNGVDAVATAEEALTHLRADPGRYFCVVTDLNMPKVNGIQLTQRIRSDPTIEHLPVIALTAYASPENLLDCVRAGITGFIAKPPRKKVLRFELEKAKRLVLTNQSPRLCTPDDAHMLEEVLQKFGPR